MRESLKNKTVSGLFWSMTERFSVQGVQFLVMLVIARILSPRDYGLVGMLAIFIAVSDTLISSGFSQALIRKQNRTESDNSTVFYFNIAVSFFLYAILYLIAPWVSVFYNEPQLCSVMRVMSLIIIIFSFGVVQRAVLTAKIDFKTQAKSSVIAAVISGVIGILLAVKGFGVWTLVFQQLINAGINTSLLWLFSTWRPKLLFSKQSFHELFAFGSKLMLVGLIDTIYNNIFQLIIGKVYSAKSLGFYSRAYHFAELPSKNITTVLQRVTYPVLCSIQNEDGKLADNYRKFLKLSAFIMFPMMIALAAVSEPMVDVLLGEKWHEASVLLVPVCLSMMWYPINAINLNLLQVKGRSDLFLRVEIIKKIQGTIILFISIPFGVITMCYATIISTLISFFINTYYTGVLIKFDFFHQIKDLLPTILVCVVMYLCVLYAISLFNTSFIRLIFGCACGVLIFFLLTSLFKFEELKEITYILKRK